MAEKTTGLSLEMIIHPGETLAEVLEDRGLTQADLAARTGVSAPFISAVINGKKRISSGFARKLAFATGVPAHFWNNLQAQYDDEMAQYEEQNSISAEERGLVKKLKPVYSYLLDMGIVSEALDRENAVMKLRYWLGVSDLRLIDRMTPEWAARKSQKVKTDPFILFAWLRMCRDMAEKAGNAKNTLQKDLLRSSLGSIKKTMFHPPEIMMEKLSEIFASCGIVFLAVRHFAGAPVQGAVLRLSSGGLALIMTLRHAWADIFWFTLMHEVGHILNGDLDEGLGDLVDFENQDADERERLADAFAAQALLDNSSYQQFVESSVFVADTIEKFAAKQRVKPFVVVGRLQREKLVSYQLLSELKTRYKWTE